MKKHEQIPGKDEMSRAALPQQIDLEHVTTLIEALKQDLNKLQGNSPEIQHLRDEVETLKNVLISPVRRDHWVTDSLHGIRERVEGALEAALAEGIQVGPYVAEIGRILGM